MLKIFTCHWRAILWSIIIIVCSVIPGNNLPDSSLPYVDKLVHFMLYFIFALFLMSGFSRQYGNSSEKKSGMSGKFYLYSFTIAITLGILLELIQEKTGRSKEYSDMIANALGALISPALFSPVKRIFKHVL
jgi:VanZ family protein